MQLLNPVTISSKVAPIKLPWPNAKVKNKAVLVVGYGCTALMQPKSKVLQKLETKMISLKECQKGFKKHKLQKSNVCTLKGVGYGCCYGDSGSPLVDISGSTILGIVSGSSGVCGFGNPDVYTKVSYYMSYIQDEMNYHPGSIDKNDNPAVNYDGNGLAEPYDFERYDFNVDYSVEDCKTCF